MIQIENTLISSDVIEKQFVCDLGKCKGVCCVEGESGAPLANNELEILKEIFPKVKPYLTRAGLKAIDKFGLHLVDVDGDDVTPLIKGRDCAYSYRENDITKCAIERAFFDKKIDFRKPISCHLFPIRITEYKDFDAVNYEVQPFCHAASTNGINLQVPVYRFLKDALIRKYGKDWYEQLEYAAENRPEE